LVVGSFWRERSVTFGQITVRGIYSLIAGKLSEGTDVVPELVEGAGRTAGKSDVKAVHRYTIARDRSYHRRSAVEVPEQNSISDKSPENVRKGVSCSLTGRGCGKLLLGTVLGSKSTAMFQGGFVYSLTFTPNGMLSIAAHIGETTEHLLIGKPSLETWRWI